MKKSFTIILFIFITTKFLLLAQSNFEYGYIIKPLNDTIYGMIDNKNYYLNSQICEFKKEGSDTVIKYYPNDIIGYRFINGKYYISKEIKINQTIQKIFLEYLINGKIDIYFYRDILDANHYLVSNDSLGIRELKYHKEIKYIDGNNLLFEQKYFVEILKSYTSDCPEIQNDILKINQPDHITFIDIAEKYHTLTCKDEKCIIYQKNIKSKLKFDFQAGTSFLGNSNTIYNLGLNFYYQALQESERVFFRIGYFRYEVNNKPGSGFWGIPLAINYIHPKNKLSPILSFGCEIHGKYFTEFYSIGLKYQIKKFSINLVSVLNTTDFFHPYMITQRVGLMYNIEK